MSLTNDQRQWYEKRYEKATPRVMVLLAEPNNQKSWNSLKGTNSAIVRKNRDNNLPDESGRLDLDLMEQLFTEVNDAFKSWDSNEGEDKASAEQRLDKAMRAIRKINKERGYPDDWYFNEKPMTEHKSLSAWMDDPSSPQEGSSMTNATLTADANEVASASVTPLRDAEVETEREPRTAAGPEVSDAVQPDAPPTNRPTLKKHTLVNGYTRKGEKIVSHRAIGAKGRQYLVATGHPACPYPLYQLLPAGELTIPEQNGYNEELEKRSRIELKEQWKNGDAKKTGWAKEDKCKEVLAVARAWSNNLNPGRVPVTFAQITLTNGSEMWISRTNLSKLAGKASGDKSINEAELDMDLKRKDWYHENNLEPPKYVIRPKIIKVSLTEPDKPSRSTGRTRPMTDTTEDRLQGERPSATPASPREGAEAAAGLAVTGAVSAPAADF